MNLYGRCGDFKIITVSGVVATSSSKLRKQDWVSPPQILAYLV